VPGTVVARRRRLKSPETKIILENGVCRHKSSLRRISRAAARAEPGTNGAMATVRPDLVPHRWVAPLLALGTAVLVLWTLVLAYRLPAEHTSRHWDVAWVGFDIALAAALGATGWSIARRASWAPSAGAVAATLLLCDAWFDTVLANGHGEQVEAALEAGLVEVPLALFCVWFARHSQQTVDAVLAALHRRPR
jgi:hypothetical protein